MSFLYLIAEVTAEPSWWQSVSETLWQWAQAAGGWLSIGGQGLIAVLLVLLCVLAWLLNLIALPGNWLAVLLLAIYAWIGPASGRLHVGLWTLGIAFALALIGELLEFAAGAVGASRAGASRRSTLMAIIGSIAGAIIGGIAGLPVPVLGQVLAALLFGGLGATAGAMLGEWTDGQSWKDSWRIGRAAFWGKTTGTIGKMLAGLLIVLAGLLGIVF